MELEAVYYAAPAPTSNRSVTLLGLVFDRLIFPGVYVPTAGVDLDEAVKEYERVRELYGDQQRVRIRSTDDLDRMHMLNLMSAALNAEYLKDFFVYTGRADGSTEEEPGMPKLAHELELAMFGPPPENFRPIVSLRFSKNLPGVEGTHINSLSWLTYPANALLYAGRTGTVLVSDNPDLPIPALGGAQLKANAKQLSTMMALESVKFVLPDLPELSLEDLAALRATTKEFVQPFRQAMLTLSKDLNAAILSDASLEDVRKEARFIVETDVAPALEHMKAELARPSRPWYRRATDLAMAAPQIVGAFATMPKGLAIATGLAKAVGILADVRDAQLEKEGLAMRGGFHYLLNIQSFEKK